MDVASPPIACSVERTTAGFEQFTLFTAMETFHTLATRVIGVWRSKSARDSHPPSVPGQGHRCP